MQADAEHQQDDADLGKLVRHALVADEARRERAHHHAGQEISDEGEALSRCASAPSAKARTSPTTMVAISGV